MALYSGVILRYLCHPSKRSGCSFQKPRSLTNRMSALLLHAVLMTRSLFSNQFEVTYLLLEIRQPCFVKSDFTVDARTTSNRKKNNSPGMASSSTKMSDIIRQAAAIPVCILIRQTLILLRARLVSENRVLQTASQKRPQSWTER